MLHAGEPICPQRDHLGSGTHPLDVSTGPSERGCTQICRDGALCYATTDGGDG